MRNKVISFILAIGALTTLSFSVRQAFAYDGSAAADYARYFCDKVSSDGWYMIGEWVGGTQVSTVAQEFPCGTSVGVVQSYLDALPGEWYGVDCAHFVSCCIGNPPTCPDYSGGGGGLDIPFRPDYPLVYGEISSSALVAWLLDHGGTEVSSVSALEEGDVIGYDTDGDGGINHVALYIGNGKVAAHSVCVCDEDWQLTYTSGFTFVHLATSIAPPIIETRPATPYVIPTAVTLNALITNDGGANINERRFDWGTTPSCSDGWTADVIVDGTSFSYLLTELEPGTTYYFRGWAHNSAGWGHGDVLNFTLPSVDDFDVIPTSITLGYSFNIPYIVSDIEGPGLSRVELWRANDSGDSPVDWTEINRTSLSGNGPVSGSFSDGPSSTGAYWYGIHVVNNAGFWSIEPVLPGPIKVTVTPGITIPPICVIELLERDRIDPIDEITVDHWFDIYVGDSTDDVGIREVRFSSDDSQDGFPQGTWTQWYDWEDSTGPYGWDSMNKRMAWSFATSGHKEVWAQLKDSEGQTSQCCDDIHVPCVCTSWQDQGCGQGPCFETQMYQTRTCDSPGCAVEARCINHMSCEPGWKSPSASGRRYNDWTNPENAYSSNDQYAVANSWSSNQDWYNFGFDIPDGSIIEGIEIGIEGTGNGDDYVGKVKCWLYWRGFILGGTETDYIEFPAQEDSLHILGGSSDLWGWDFWSPEDIVGEGFGVRLSTGLDWHTARIDSIQARIYYRVCPDVSHDWLGLPCLVNSWLQQCNLGNDYCNCCDMNNDGIIDFADVAIFAQHWLEGL